MYWRTTEHHNLKHNPFTALVNPRPIGWISSYDSHGVPNLAPFSFFNIVSYLPYQLMFSVGPKEDGSFNKKDTLANVESTGCFVANVVTWELREAMNITSAMLPSEVNEFELAGVTPVASSRVNAPYVKESPVNFECEVLNIVPLKPLPGKPPNVIVIGEVHGVRIDDGLISDGMVDYSKLKTVARLGYRDDYAVTTDIFRMLKPVSEKLNYSG